MAFHPSGRAAYVTNSVDGTVSVIDLAGRKVSKVVSVGVEPMGVATSPNGTRLYVANAASNTLSVLDNVTDPTLGTLAAIDLSAYGHSPRSIAVTDDGDSDDTDETIFVALFFGQLRSGKGSLHEGQDDQREGRVVAISAATNTIIRCSVLGPMASAGFNSNGALAPASGLVPAVASTNPQTFTTPTGAFPNQLAQVALTPDGSRAYVVSTAASPNGPVRFNHNVQGLLSFFDVFTGLEVTSGQSDPAVRRTAPLNLNQGINLSTTPAPRLFMSNPVAMAWRPDGSDAWIAVQASDLLVRVTTDGSGVPSIGAPLVAGPSSIVRVDLRHPPTDEVAGVTPRGLAINSSGSRAYVFNFVSRSISVVDISDGNAPEILYGVRASKMPTTQADIDALKGAELFFSGRGPEERMSAESWGSCVTCHPNGRSDNVTWMFPAGPRQTVNLDGMFSKLNPSDQRILNWSAIFDENQDFELNTRGVFGGRGLIDDDRVFLAIGGARTSPLDSAHVEQFHQVTGAVTNTNALKSNLPLPSLPTARRDFGVATLDDDRVFIIGGRRGAGQGSLVSSGSVLEFNPRTNKLVAKSSVGFTPRHSLGAAAVNTADGLRIYAFGGYSSTSASDSPTSVVEEYNPYADTWRTVATLPEGKAQFGTAVSGGHNSAEPLQLIHVVSGNAGSEASPFVGGSFAVQRFQADPFGPGVWTTFNPTGLTARRNHGAATAVRGVSSRIFIIGGQDGSGTVLDTVEEYVAQGATAVLTPHTSLPAARARFGISSSLSTNQIYVIGGADTSGLPTSSVFEYTIGNNGPAPGPLGTPSGSWVARGSMSVARSGLGVSTPPGVTSFLPARNGGRSARQDQLASFIARFRPARAAVSGSDPAAMIGRTLFGTDGLVIPGMSCATCHGGSKWTRSTVDYPAPPSPDTGLGLGNEKVIGAELRSTATQSSVLNNVGTFTLTGRSNEIRFNGADISQTVNPLGANGFNIPSLLSVHETAPYYYSGLAQTLEQVLDGTADGSGGTRAHFVSDPAMRAQLISFLRSIDETTPIFP
ncbi:MAG: beta-propeller fold lactonase family protein [Deltaproteobacteria bacterium]|nr:beta-propeller fold lactonase family protein [Deltaproteobacteria bacterium]